jgi:sec-independent protein translocase protein TatC
LGGGVAYAFWEEIWGVLARPITHQGLHVEFIAISPMETVMTSFKLSLATGFLLAFPIIVWQAWRFIAPALFHGERKVFLGSFGAAVIMFFAGAAFCYFAVLPAGLQFLASYTEGIITQNWKQADYASFITKFLVAFGLIFELPVVTFVLSRMGLITPASMRSSIRYAVVVIFLVAAFLTPGPDPVSQILMALPMCLLYGLSIGVCALAQPKDEGEASASDSSSASSSGKTKKKETVKAKSKSKSKAKSKTMPEATEDPNREPKREPKMAPQDEPKAEPKVEPEIKDKTKPEETDL